MIFHCYCWAVPSNGKPDLAWCSPPELSVQEIAHGGDLVLIMPPQLMIKDKIRQSILQRGPLPNKNKQDCIIQKKKIDINKLNN